MADIEIKGTSAEGTDGGVELETPNTAKEPETTPITRKEALDTGYEATEPNKKTKMIASVIAIILVIGVAVYAMETGGLSESPSNSNNPTNVSTEDTSNTDTSTDTTDLNPSDYEIDEDNMLNQLTGVATNADPEVEATYENDLEALAEIKEIYGDYYNNPHYCIFSYDESSYSAVMHNSKGESFTQGSAGDIYIDLSDGTEVGFMSTGEIYYADGRSEAYLPMLMIEMAEETGTNLLTQKYEMTEAEINSIYAVESAMDYTIPESVTRYTIQTQTIDDIKQIYDSIAEGYGDESVNNFMEMVYTSTLYQEDPNTIPHMIAKFWVEDGVLTEVSYNINFSGKTLDVNNDITWSKTFTLFMSDTPIDIEDWELQEAYYTYDYDQLSVDQGEYIVAEINKTFNTLYECLYNSGMLDEIPEGDAISTTEITEES